MRLGRGIFDFEKPPRVLSCAAVVGKKESEGPLGQCFDLTHADNTLGEDSWEKAESKLQLESVTTALQKVNLKCSDLDVLFSGDLLNQCIASTFGLITTGAPFIGMYGACSTMASTLLNASVFVSSGCADICAALTSSHFCSAERQYRMPLQYGGQRPPTAQWTVTGSGAVILSSDENASPVGITAACAGIINDLGIKDPNNMGAAMAPAACSTIERFFSEGHRKPEDYDVIMTGDLGFVGHDILLELLSRDGIDCSNNLTDGGMLIYDREAQDVHAGGSGCGCSASVLCGYFLPKLLNGDMKKMLFIATGALMSPTSSYQGEAIPAVAHAIEFSVLG